MAKDKIVKTKIYESENWNLTISTYPFNVSKTDEFWVVTNSKYDLVEISKTSRKWSDEIKWYYEKKSFVSIGLEEFKNILKYIELETL